MSPLLDRPYSIFLCINLFNLIKSLILSNPRRKILLSLFRALRQIHFWVLRYTKYVEKSMFNMIQVRNGSILKKRIEPIWRLWAWTYFVDIYFWAFLKFGNVSNRVSKHSLAGIPEFQGASATIARYNLILPSEKLGFFYVIYFH